MMHVWMCEFGVFFSPRAATSHRTLLHHVLDSVCSYFRKSSFPRMSLFEVLRFLLIFSVRHPCLVVQVIAVQWWPYFPSSSSFSSSWLISKFLLKTTSNISLPSMHILCSCTKSSLEILPVQSCLANMEVYKTLQWYKVLFFLTLPISQVDLSLVWAYSGL